MWSAETPDDFSRVDRYVVGGGGSGKTQHAVWNPISDHVSSVVVSSTGHDMFCPGVTMMPNGDIIVTGGQNADKTSIYHLVDGTWNVAPEMHISRGYGSSCLLSNGKVCAANLPACCRASELQPWANQVHCCGLDRELYLKTFACAGICVGGVVERPKGSQEGCRDLRRHCWHMDSAARHTGSIDPHRRS